MMIDFHTHILPQIDDGAKSPAVAAEMLKMEYEQGAKEVLTESIRQFITRRF